MDDYGNTVHRNRWAIAAAAGFVAFLLFWLSIEWGFFGGLLAGVIVFVILLVVIGLIGADAPAARDDTSGKSRTTGDRDVPPNVAAGAGGAGGAAAAAASPATARRSESGAAQRDDDGVDATADPAENTSEAAPDAAAAETTSEPATHPAAAETTSEPAAEPVAADLGAAVRDGGSAGDPVTEPAAEEPATEEPAPEAPTVTPMSPSDERPAKDDDGPAVGTGSAPDGEGSKPETLSAARDGKPDDLRKIKGIGPKLAALCNSLGFWHFDQIAGWSEAEVDWVDAHLEGFKGRVRRDDWVAQARMLASGGEDEFSTKVDKGDVY